MHVFNVVSCSVLVLVYSQYLYLRPTFRGVAKNLIGGGVYVLTSHCNFQTYVPHVNIYHIESVLGHRRRTTT